MVRKVKPKYDYLAFDKEYDDLRAELTFLGDRDRKGLIKHIPQSHENMVRFLNLVKDNSDMNLKALEAIEEFDRTEFFDWDNNPQNVKDQNITPYTFEENIIANGKTIPSAHIALYTACSLNLKDGQKILEIGAGSAYNAVIVQHAAGENSQVYSTEIDPDLLDIARKNVYSLGLESKVKILPASFDGLGLAENEPFDRIYTDLAGTTTSQVESLLDQLAIGGFLRLSMAKVGNTPDEEEAKFWEPGMNLTSDDLYLSVPEKNLFRVSSFAFKKVSETQVEYRRLSVGAQGPLFS